MKLEDVKVGMKVVPISKSAGIKFDTMKKYIDDLKKHKVGDSVTDCFDKYGFLYVVDIVDEVVHLWGNKYNGSGDKFLPEDFEPYVEPQVKIKKEKNMKGKLRFEDLRIGDKLTLRDDLIVGKKYGDITYLKEMQEVSGVVTVLFIDKNISLNEGYYRFWYSKEMFKEFTTTQYLSKNQNPNPPISPIHVPDILADALNMDWSDESELVEIRNTIKQCIDSLNSTQE